MQWSSSPQIFRPSNPCWVACLSRQLSRLAVLIVTPGQQSDKQIVTVAMAAVVTCLAAEKATAPELLQVASPLEMPIIAASEEGLGI